MSLDGARLAILASRLDAITRRMTVTLLRSARSTIINAARDFSCCLLTADGRLLAVGESLPIHVLAGTDEVARGLLELDEPVARGDAFLHNSPYHGNSHAADHCILVPVFDDAGGHRFTVLVKAHQADCGNSQPTTYFAGARDVYEEGALIFPWVRVQHEYRMREDVLRMCAMRIRVPDQWRGDFTAALGTARIGERLVAELAADVGWDELAKLADGIVDHGRRSMRAAIAALPAGSASLTTRHDAIPELPEGIELNVGVEVLPQEGRVVVDLRDNPDCVPCGLNLTAATSRAAATLGVFNGLGADVAPNAGSLACVEVLLRRGCVVGIPEHPTSCSVATSNLTQRVASAVSCALADLADGFGLAEAGTGLPPAVAVASGTAPDGTRFVNQLSLALTGGPAAPRADGWLTLAGVETAGMCRLDAVEVDELRYPLRVDQQRLIPDSGGAGRTRGAAAARVELGPVGCDVELAWTSDGTDAPARGARGGAPGSRARQVVVDAAGEERPAGISGVFAIRDGERVVADSCGGGGYGDPGERAREEVRRDVAEGLVSAAAAGEVYGLEAVSAPVGLAVAARPFGP